MKVKIPEYLKILTHTYHIRYDTKQLASQGCAGLARHLHQEINLDDRCYPQSELNQIFMHEVLHTIERHFDISIDDKDIDRMSEGIMLVFEQLGIELDFSDIKEEK